MLYCTTFGMPAGDTYSSGHLVLSHFETCICSNVETNLFWTCLVSGLLNFEHPSVLLFFFLLSGHTLSHICVVSLCVVMKTSIDPDFFTLQVIHILTSPSTCCHIPQPRRLPHGTFTMKSDRTVWSIQNKKGHFSSCICLNVYKTFILFLDSSMRKNFQMDAILYISIVKISLYPPPLDTNDFSIICRRDIRYPNDTDLPRYEFCPTKVLALLKEILLWLDGIHKWPHEWHDLYYYMPCMCKIDVNYLHVRKWFTCTSLYICEFDFVNFIFCSTFW